jgi:hypothetical protein
VRLARVVILGRANGGTAQNSRAFIWVLLAGLAICDGLWPVIIRGWWASSLNIGVQRKHWLCGFWVPSAVGGNWSVGVWVARIVVLGWANVRAAKGSWALIWVLLAELAISDSLGPVLVRRWWATGWDIGVDS